MSPARPGTARVTTFVAVDPAAAFAVFTDHIGSWWRPGRRFTFDTARSGTPRFEGTGPGARLVFAITDSDEVFEVGKVLVWQPGERLVFEFRARVFAPGELTEVEVLFEPDGDGTRVVLEHRGWDKLAADHPVRHGLGRSSAFIDMIGLWWGELVTSMRAYAARTRAHST